MRASAIACLLLVAAWIVSICPTGWSLEAQQVMTSAQSDYVEHCSGCHGIQGSSLPAKVPLLRDRVGQFLCTSDGRNYILRLPNVALSSADDDQLAAIMNFVVFRLGGHSVPPGSVPFTAAEIAAQRRNPLSSASLIAVRARTLSAIERKCGKMKPN